MSHPTFTSRTEGNSASATLDAAIRRHLSALGTCGLAQVKAVHIGNGLTGTVDLQPLTHQQTSDGTPIPHGTIYGIPYLRIQGGACAVIVDPAVGDIGYMIVSGRDQTNAVANRAPSPPATFRQHCMADCVYIGAYLGDAPDHYVQITSGGIRIVTKGTVEIQAQSAAINCDLSVSGNVTAQGDVTAGTISLQKHVHQGVKSGSDTSGPAQ